MIVIVIKQAGMVTKHLGPINADMNQGHRIASRLRTRAEQLKIFSFTATVHPIEEFDGGNLDRALAGFVAHTTIGDES